jgi:nucleoside-diphosphate-sugar epimerase
MNLLITGSSGFVGSSFLLNCKEININPISLRNTNLDQIEFSNKDCILHLAALVHQMKGAPDDQYYSVNRDLTFELARAAKEHGVKHFVFLSSVKVFGEFTTNLPAWNENSECLPTDAYGKSKLEAEKLLFSLEDENFKVAVIRSPLVYGVGVKANMLNLIKLINTVPVIPLNGINNKRTMVYVGNLIALIQHVINRQSSGIFIASDKTSLSTTELAKLIANASHKKRLFLKIPNFILSIGKKLKPGVIDRLFGSLELDSSITNSKLGFCPPFESEFGIQEMVDWYKASQK